ncbi:hypothetical protein KAH27_11090, partial [bacterium]|nr:hypothetical protein [bacterium]
MILILVVFITAIYLLYPTYQFSSMTTEQKEKMRLDDPQGFLKLKSKAINLGLDLQGGMHVILEVDIKELLDKLAKYKNDEFNKALNATEEQVAQTDEDFISVFIEKLKVNNVKIERFYANSDRRTESDVISFLREQTTEAVTRSLEILRNRVDEFGVSEPIIQKQGDRRIIVELAGITDPTRVRKLIGETALLEFKLLKDNVVAGQVAENINNFIISKISPADTSTTENGEKKDTSATALEEMFGVTDSDSAKTETALSKEDSASGLYEEGLFFLDPRDKQTLLVPVDKKEKFKLVLQLPEVQKIISDDAGNSIFVWGAKPVFDDKYYQVYLVAKTIELTGETIVDAFPQPGSQSDPTSIGKYEVSLTFSDDGARIFSRVTGANIGKRLAIILDNKVFLAPSLRVKISDGHARITGLDKMSEAKDLAIV